MPTPVAIFSSMTIELSTTIPTPTAKPPKLNTLRDRPNSFIKIIELKAARGIDETIITVWRKEPKNNNTAIAANPAPVRPALVTFLMALLIKIDSSVVETNSKSSGITPDVFNCSSFCLMPLTTAIVLASGCF